MFCLVLFCLLAFSLNCHQVRSRPDKGRKNDISRRENPPGKKTTKQHKTKPKQKYKIQSPKNISSWMDCDRKRTSKKSDLGRRNQKENTRKKSKTIHWTNERSVEYIRTSCHTQTHTRYCATCDKRSVSFVLARRNAFFFFLFFVCVLSLYKSSSLVQLKSQTEDEEEKRERERGKKQNQRILRDRWIRPIDSASTGCTSNKTRKRPGRVLVLVILSEILYLSSDFSNVKNDKNKMDRSLPPPPFFFSV